MNKELPKEVVEKIDNLPMFESDRAKYKAGFQIAQSHYAPIIEAKDKEIAEQKEELSRRGTKIVSDRNTYTQIISEQSARIAELEAEVKKVMGLLRERDI